MLIAIQEWLKLGLQQVALAQTIQCIKALRQSVLSGGDWQTAWLLAGLVEPVQRREFAGEEGEMSAIAAYLGALSDLKKKIKGGNTRADHSSDSGSEAEAELTGVAGEEAAAKRNKKKKKNKKGAQKGKEASAVLPRCAEPASSQEEVGGSFSSAGGRGVRSQPVGRKPSALILRNLASSFRRRARFLRATIRHFAGFAICLSLEHGPLPARAGSRTHLFPSDLPFREAELSGAIPLDSRRRRRFLFTQRCHRWVKALWALFSFCELGCPDDASSVVFSWKEVPSKLRLKYASRLVIQVRAFCRSDGPLSECPLEVAGERVSEVLKSVPVNKYCVPFRGWGGININIACEIDPSLVALPEVAGAVDPTPF
ncbi:unnamed protein product [Polarella glacialis]|uniref:Uncharacterized protein n=1 Tax=Polarella glacialis TaxID=89957 RepID=A0A813K1J0_POLGL|nr:unnamed protein product [Polarella glacialis]